MAGHWYAIPFVAADPGSHPRVCEGDRCTRVARWCYVGDSGELWACDDHHALAVQP